MAPRMIAAVNVPTHEKYKCLLSTLYIIYITLNIYIHIVQKKVKPVFVNKTTKPLKQIIVVNNFFLFYSSWKTSVGFFIAFQLK